MLRKQKPWNNQVVEDAPGVVNGREVDPKAPNDPEAENGRKVPNDPEAKSG
jgi:hypothetical protein